MMDVVAQAVAAEMKAIGIDFGSSQDGYARIIARAAVTAMRIPDAKMRRAASKAMSPENKPAHWVSNTKKHAIRYRAMIDAALEELSDV